MSFAPKQDWAAYPERLAQEHAEWVRSLTVSERFAIYADLFRVVWEARQRSAGDWESLDQHRWEQKLALRMRLVRVFQRMDELASSGPLQQRFPDSH